MRLNTILVRFVDSDGDYEGKKEYAYFTDLDLEINDLVVVQARGFYGICIVTKTIGLSKNQLSKATRWVVNKIEVERMQLLQEQSDAYFEIKNRLRAAKENFEERQIYEAMAKHDPEIAKLLDTLKNLTGTNLIEG